MKVYISGPMSGYEDFNYPAFFEAEKKIRAMGFDVENPARNPDPEPKTWEGFMRMAIKQVCDCGTVVILKGWADSRGAKIEVKLAKEIGIEVTTLEEFLKQ